MLIEHVARVLWRRLIAPDRHGVHPGMDFETGPMRSIDDVSERVEGWVEGRIVERRLDSLRVERITAATNLDHQRVQVCPTRRDDEFVGLTW